LELDISPWYGYPGFKTGFKMEPKTIFYMKLKEKGGKAEKNASELFKQLIAYRAFLFQLMAEDRVLPEVFLCRLDIVALLLGDSPCWHERA
jgi:hypothetical protein